MKEYPCDICHQTEAIEVPHCREYTKGQPIHICGNCGFVYVKNRRSSEEIAKTWSDEIFSDNFTDVTYTARVPAVKARQVYVADHIDVEVGLENKLVCDIGAGEGQFLEIMSGPEYKAKVFAVEPSERNCKLLKSNGFDSFNGTAEEFRASDSFKENHFDIVTMTWTLCNSFSCRDIMNIAWDMLKPGGHLVIAEGSRIMVPFKKPMTYYLKTLQPDLHPYHFSETSLRNLYQTSGFEVVNVNRFIDTDYLVMVGQKKDKKASVEIIKEDANAVKSFFERWHQETQYYIQEDANV